MDEFQVQTRGDEQVLPGFRPRSAALSRPSRPARYLPVMRLRECAADVEEALRAGDAFIAQNVALYAERLARTSWYRCRVVHQLDLPL